MEKIWVFASNFNNWAGPNNHLLDLCNHLYRNMGVDVGLVTHDAKANEDFIKHIFFPTYRILSGSTPTPKSRLLHAYSNSEMIRKISRTQSISVNSVFVNSSIDTLYSAYLAFRHRLATGYNVLSNQPHSAVYNRIDKIAGIVAVRKILAHTQFHKQIYLKLGIDEDQITVLPHCIDVKRVEETAAQNVDNTSDESTIVFVGSLTLGKGVMVLLEAYQRILRTQNSKLVIIGDGPLRDRVLEQKRITEKTSGRIDYLGWQPPSILLKAMRKATVVVVPSFEEAFGMVVIEAMCLRKPVVASRVGGLAEIVDDGYNGLLVNPGDSEKLADAIIELLIDPGKCSTMGSNGYITVENNYSAYKIAPKFLHFMDVQDD